MLRPHFEWMDAKFGQSLRHTFWVNAAWHQFPRITWLLWGFVEEVRNHHTVDWFGWVAWPPAHHKRLHVILVEYVPDSFATPGNVGHWLNRFSAGCGLGKPVNAVFERSFSCGNGRPQHGRKNGRKRSHVSHHALLNHIANIGQHVLFSQFVDDFPICRIPAD